MPLYNRKGEKRQAEGPTAAAEALEMNSTIKTIDLYNNNIGDQGAEALAKGLEKNRTIERIDLYNNKGLLLLHRFAYITIYN